MSNNPPAFQLYAADFYMDTVSWPIEAVGIYTRFLFYQWVNGALPNDEKELARIAGCSVKKLLNNSIYWSTKFIKKDDKNLINLRLEETRKKQLEYKEKQAISGSKGGKRAKENRQKESSEPSSEPTTEPSSEKVALQSSSSSSNNNLIKANDLVSSENEKSSEPLKESALSETAEHNELRGLVNQIMSKFPKLPIVKFLQTHNRDHPKAVIHSLKSLLNHDIKFPEPFVLMKYLETTIGIENGKYNAMDSEARNNEFKNDTNPLAALLAGIGKPMPKVQGVPP